MPHTLTFAIMDAPFESARTTTAFRIIRAALDQGFNVNVFAYEGAVALTFARQQAHANAVHERDAAAENHPLTRLWVAELQRFATAKGLHSQRSTDRADRARVQPGAAAPVRRLRTRVALVSR